MQLAQKRLHLEVLVVRFPVARSLRDQKQKLAGKTQLPMAVHQLPMDQPVFRSERVHLPAFKRGSRLKLVGIHSLEILFIDLNLVRHKILLALDIMLLPVILIPRINRQSVIIRLPLVLNQELYLMALSHLDCSPMQVNSALRPSVLSQQQQVLIPLHLGESLLHQQEIPLH